MNTFQQQNASVGVIFSVQSERTLSVLPHAIQMVFLIPEVKTVTVVFSGGMDSDSFKLDDLMLSDSRIRVVQVEVRKPSALLKVVDVKQYDAILLASSDVVWGIAELKFMLSVWEEEPSRLVGMEVHKESSVVTSRFTIFSSYLAALFLNRIGAYAELPSGCEEALLSQLSFEMCKKPPLLLDGSISPFQFSSTLSVSCPSSVVEALAISTEVLSPVRYRTKLMPVRGNPLYCQKRSGPSSCGTVKAPPFTADFANHSLPEWASRAPNPSPEGLSMMFNAFNPKRQVQLRDLIYHYSASPIVHTIYVLWSNIFVPAPLVGDFVSARDDMRIIVVRHDNTSFNNRFLPPPSIQTECMVSIDDDIKLPLPDLEFAFYVWQQHRRRLVGVFARTHRSPDGSTLHYDNPGVDTGYSIVLTKFMLFNKDFLYSYSFTVPKAVHTYIDEQKNCEDIAFSIHSSVREDKPPILVHGLALDLGMAGGVSQKVGHYNARTDCVETFFKLLPEANKLKSCFYQIAPDSEPSPPVLTAPLMRGWPLLETKVFPQHSEHAYVTSLHRMEDLDGVLGWSRILRRLGVDADLILMIPMNLAQLLAVRPDLSEAFTSIRLLEDAASTLVEVEILPQLSAWLLTSYKRVIWLSVHHLPLFNLDPLFELTAPAAAPHPMMRSCLDAGFMVIEPSQEGFDKLLLKTYSKRPQRDYAYPDSLAAAKWFSSRLGFRGRKAPQRLPARFNFPPHKPAIADLDDVITETSVLPISLATALEDSSALHLALNGPVTVVNFEFSRIKPWEETQGDVVDKWTDLWWSLSGRPQHVTVNQWQISSAPSLSQVLAHRKDLFVEKSKCQVSVMEVTPRMTRAIATFVDSHLLSVTDLSFLASWVDSVTTSAPGAKLVLVLPKGVPKNHQFLAIRRLFDDVVEVDRIRANVAIGDHRTATFDATLLRLWELEFDAVGYICPLCSAVLPVGEMTSIHRPFSAPPASWPADRFSGDVFTLRPSASVFEEMMKVLEGEPKLYAGTVESFLNIFFGEWAGCQARQRPPHSWLADVMYDHLSMLMEARVRRFDRTCLPWVDSPCLRYGSALYSSRKFCSSLVTVERELSKKTKEKFVLDSQSAPMCEETMGKLEEAVAFDV